MTVSIFGQYLILSLQRTSIAHLGGEPDQVQYILEIGGVRYNNDEIPQSLRISMSTPANGYSVGNLAMTTISGTVEYKGGSFQRNGIINLYVDNVLVFTWFLKDCTVYNNSSVTFTGVCAMAFTNNEYSINTDDTIGTQFTTAISTLNSLIGQIAISIDRPSSADTSAIVYDKQSKWTIKSLMEASAKIDCVNYYTECTANLITLKKSTWSEVGILSADDYTPLSVGVSDTPINYVRVFQSDMEIPKPNTDEGETLADYGIYETATGAGQPTAASTMKIVTPLATSDIDMTNYVAVLGNKYFGTQFSCSLVKTPNNNFFIPMSKITFGQSYNTNYYICNADYSLTVDGIYASISGTARNVSDYEYVGETSQSIRKKIELNHDYKGSVFTINDGMTWQENEDTVAVNSG